MTCRFLYVVGLIINIEMEIAIQFKNQMNIYENIIPFYYLISERYLNRYNNIIIIIIQYQYQYLI